MPYTRFDHSSRNRTGRAIMQFANTLAYMEGDEMAVLRPDLPPALFKYSGHKLVEQSGSSEILAKKALAHSLFAKKAYADRLYR